MFSSETKEKSDVRSDSYGNRNVISFLIEVREQ